MNTQLPHSPERFSLYNNPAPRCPVAVLLDTSYSMSGRPIAELHEGVCRFFYDLIKDPTASQSVEVCVVTYGERARVELPFSDLSSGELPRLKPFTASGMTPMGEAMGLGYKKLRERRKEYKRAGLSAYKPWMVLLTDGMPNDEWEAPAEKIRNKAQKGDLFFLAVGIGEDADMDILRSISTEEFPPHRLAGLRFNRFFAWLSDSLKSVSRSTPECEHNGHAQFRPTDDWAFA